jgi:hypothetical protein
MGTETVVRKPAHKNQSQSISDDEDGNAACAAIPLSLVSLTTERTG